MGRDYCMGINKGSKKDDKIARFFIRHGDLFYQSSAVLRQVDAISKNEFISDGYLGYGNKVSVIREQGKVKAVKIGNTTYQRADEPGPVKNFKWKKA